VHECDESTRDYDVFVQKYVESIDDFDAKTHD
jgi:hypothetical protein